MRASRSDIATVAAAALAGALVFSLGPGARTRAGGSPATAPAGPMLGACRISAERLPSRPQDRGGVRLRIKVANPNEESTSLSIRLTAQQISFTKAAVMSRSMPVSLPRKDYRHKTFVVEVPARGEKTHELVLALPAGSYAVQASLAGAHEGRVDLLSVNTLPTLTQATQLNRR